MRQFLFSILRKINKSIEYKGLKLTVQVILQGSRQINTFSYIIAGNSESFIRIGFPVCERQI